MKHLLLAKTLFIYIKNNIIVIYMKGCSAPYSSANFSPKDNYPGSYVAYNKMEYTGGRKRKTRKRTPIRRRRRRQVSRRRRRRSSSRRKSQRGG
jgi:hypothetical protein